MNNNKEMAKVVICACLMAIFLYAVLDALNHKQIIGMGRARLITDRNPKGIVYLAQLPGVYWVEVGMLAFGFLFFSYLLWVVISRWSGNRP